MSRQRGHTYLSVLVTIVVLETAVAHSVALGSGILRRDLEEELLFVGAQYRQALLSYANATPLGGHSAPKSMDELVRDERSPIMKRHIRRLYVDPMTSRLDWKLHLDQAQGIIGLGSIAPGTPRKQVGFGTAEDHMKSAPDYGRWVFTPNAALLAGLRGLNASPDAGTPEPTNSRR